MKRPIAVLLASLSIAIAAAAPPAFGHGAASKDYKTTIVSVKPDGLPVDVRIVGGDQVRFENQGDKDLVICGYDREGCEPWVRITPDGVYVDKNSKSWYQNSAAVDYGDVPADAGTKPDWQRVRKGPPFYAYHDHRVHWMGTSTPPNVDTSDPSPQKVFDADIKFRYGDTDGVVTTRLDYVGGANFFKRNLEQLIVWTGVLVMLLVFALDFRKRRKLKAAEAPTPAPATLEGNES